METWLVTAYCLGVACGALDHGITTSGARARVGYTAACPPELPFGTALIIQGKRWICEDRGSAIQGKHVDLFLSDRKAALRFGARWLRVRRVGLPPWTSPGCPREATSRLTRSSGAE